MSPLLANRIAEDFAAAAHATHDLQRHRAMEVLAERGLPSSRDENWKYVNLRPLEKVRFAPPGPEAQSPVTAQDLPAPIAQDARYTFIDGVLAPALSGPTTRAGVAVRPMRTNPPVGGDSVASPDLRFALLNEAFATDGALVQVEPGTDCQTCVELVFVATAEAKA